MRMALWMVGQKTICWVNSVKKLEKFVYIFGIIFHYVFKLTVNIYLCVKNIIKWILTQITYIERFHLYELMKFVRNVMPYHYLIVCFSTWTVCHCKSRCEYLIVVYLMRTFCRTSIVLYNISVKCFGIKAWYSMVSNQRRDLIRYVVVVIQFE